MAPAEVPAGSLLAEFEVIFATQVSDVTAFFARRSSEPETVADLTSETFARAIGSFGSFDPARGRPGAWLFGIARHVFAQHCARSADEHDATGRLSARRALEEDEFEEIAGRIDAERQARELLNGLDGFPTAEREALELVDLPGLELKLVQEHGAELTTATRQQEDPRRPTPLLVTGGAIGLAGVVAAVALAVTATTSPPAFAVIHNRDGTVTLTVRELGRSRQRQSRVERARRPCARGAAAIRLQIRPQHGWTLPTTRYRAVDRSRSSSGRSVR